MKQLGSKLLETERLILRPFRAADAEQAFYGWMNDPAVTRYLTWQPHADIRLTQRLLAAWEAAAKDLCSYRWAIVCREENVPVGEIGMRDADMRSERAELGYCLARRAWGRGFATEALRRVLDFLFGEVGFRRIEAAYAAENTASGRVLAKCGMRQEGLLRSYYRLPSTGEWTDFAICAILRGEWAEIAAERAF